MAMTHLIGGRYRLERELGSGGMGTVYAAYDRLDDKFVALKRVHVAMQRLSFNSRDDSSSALALAREFRILAALRHPHIISVQDYGFAADRQPYFTMQLLEGASPLTDQAERSHPDRAAQLLLPVLYALDYLHRNRIIHRDLKPANILIDGDGVVRVLDFGLAIAHNITSADGTAGTLLYMAPELMRGGEPSIASDLYAFGIIACQVLTRMHPFAASSTTASLALMAADRPALDLNTLPAPWDTLIPHLIARDPFARIESAQVVIAALGAASDADTPVLRESFLQAAAFVGRSTEMALLETAAHKATNGTGSAYLIGGESGIGKSRLAAELAIRAQVNGAIVLRGRASPHDRPFGAWHDVVRRAALLVDLTPSEASTLLEIVLDLARLIERPVSPPAVLPSKAAYDRLIGAIITLIRRAAETQPIVLIMDDIHWLGDGLEVLRALAAAASQLSLLLLATYRSDEAPDLPTALPDMQPIPLSRLDSAAIERLSAAMLGESHLTPAVLDTLERETEGNAFFLVEVVRALAEAAGGLNAIRDETLPARILPGGVEQVIRARLSRVPEWGQALLDAAAIAGREIDRVVLAHSDLLPSGHTPDEWVTACIHSAILSMEEGRVLFNHDKLREAVLDRLSADAHRRLSRVIAHAIESAHPDDPGYAGALAQHWRAAEEPARELASLKVYGAQLKRRAAFLQARDAYARAIDLLLADTLLDAHAKAAEHAELLSQLGEVSFIASDYDTAQTALDECITLASQIGAAQAHARALRRRADMHRLHGNYEQWEALLMQSLTIARTFDDPAGLCISLKEMGYVRETQGRYDDAMIFHQEALTVARAAGDLTLEASVLNDMGIVHALRGELAQARALWDDSLTLKERAGDRYGIAATTMNLGMLANDMGDSDAAIAYAMQTVRMWDEIGSKPNQAAARNNLSNFLANAGRLFEARAFHEEAYTLQVAIGDVKGIVDSLSNRALIAFFEHRFEEVIAVETEALALRRTIHDDHSITLSLMHRGAAHALLGNVAEARADLPEAARHALNIDVPPLYWTVLVLMAAVAFAEAQPYETLALLALAEATHAVHSTDGRHLVSLLSAPARTSLSADEIAAAEADGRARDPRRVLGAVVDDLSAL
jgi:tetratricopeptide (TPR) repeat protein